jgi:hypothetical protein
MATNREIYLGWIKGVLAIIGAIEIIVLSLLTNDVLSTIRRPGTLLDPLTVSFLNAFSASVALGVMTAVFLIIGAIIRFSIQPERPMITPSSPPGAGRYCPTCKTYQSITAAFCPNDGTKLA